MSSLDTRSADFEDEGRRIDPSVMGLDSWWRGSAAEACSGTLTTWSGVAAAMSEPIAAVSTALRSYVDEIAEIAKLNQGMAQQIHAANKAVDEAYRQFNAARQAGADLAGVNATVLAKKSHRDDLEATIDSLVARRTAADEALVAAVNAQQEEVVSLSQQNSSYFAHWLAMDPYSAADAPGNVGRDEVDRVQNMSPEDRFQWWRDHSSQRYWLMATYPEIFGNLDGIPALDRDIMNRGRIDAMRDDLENQLRDPNSRANRDEIQKKIDAIDALKATLNDPNFPDRYLLLLDPSGHQMKAAVACGNIDEADNVAVLTGGVSTQVGQSVGEDGKLHGGMVGMANDADRIRRAAEYSDPSKSTAVIAWMGYEAPTGFTDSAVLSPARAKEGATALRSFSQGINASHAGDPHLTLLGHSYGSTVTGIALEGKTGADDTVLFGSPGMGSGPKNIPDGHLYAERSRDDPIAWATGLTMGDDPVENSHVTTLSVAANGGLNASAGHSEYLKEGTVSLANIGNIVAGTPENLINISHADQEPAPAPGPAPTPPGHS